MALARSIAIVVAWVTLVLGQAYAVITSRELWPLSDYPMYADKQGPRVSIVAPEGRTASGELHRVALREELMPFDPSRLLGLLRRVGRGSNSGEKREEATRALLALYEANRVAGRHAGPPLVSLDVYEETYRIVPWAKNKNERPEKKKLVASTREQDGER